jgi:hypothetical protein
MALDKRRDELFKALDSEEQVYIRSYYQEKEPQFCRAYTQQLPNLGVYSTQRNESYHVVVKTKLHQNLPISKAVYTIADQIAELGRKYDAEINHNRRSLPRLLDKAAFAVVGDQLTHYALRLVMREWSATKAFGDRVESKLETLNFEPGTACKFVCQLPVRYGLLCKHWLYKAFVDNVPIPLSLFHPRWLLNGPPVLYHSWDISWNSALNSLEQGSLALDP